MCHDVKEVASFGISLYGQKLTTETFFKQINLCSAEEKRKRLKWVSKPNF